MRTSVTDIETDVVDLSQCDLQEAMTIQDPMVVDSLKALLARLAEQPGLQSSGGGDNPDDTASSEHFPTLCQGSRD